jgi:hypothetical protein
MSAPRRVVRIGALGDFANRMIQHMVANSMVDGIDGARIQGQGLPHWHIEHDPPDDAPPDLVLEGQLVNLEAARAVLSRPEGGVVQLQAYGQQFGSFPHAEAARRMFRVPDSHSAVEGFGSDRLVINIRGKEVLDAVHPHYTLNPVAFIVELVHRTGLRPVFLGQIGIGPYFDDLRAAFPSADFVASRDPMTDFTVIRRSRNILVPVSTFSWLAAWLSDADRVHLPVCGLFNPMQIPDIDLLPLADERYAFHLFPITYAVLPHEVRAAHAAMEGLWREVPPDFLDAVRSSAPRVARRLDEHLAWFDQHEYMSLYPRIAEMIRAGLFVDAVTHYRDFGYADRRSPCAFDRVWYAREYPLAALEVTEGDYADLFHHWLVIGNKRGYLRTPPEKVAATVSSS